MEDAGFVKGPIASEVTVSVLPSGSPPSSVKVAMHEASTVASSGPSPPFDFEDSVAPSTPGPSYAEDEDKGKGQVSISQFREKVIGKMWKQVAVATKP